MDVTLVRFLERRAQALHIPYTATTAPQALLEMVSDAEHRDVRARGQEGMPGCFGALFAGPYSPDCDICQVQTACMARLAWVKMPQVVVDIGTNDPPNVASALDIDPKAVVLAQTFAAQAAGRDTALFEGYTLLKPPPKPIVVALSDIPRPFALAAYASILGSRAKLKVWQRDITRLQAPGVARLLGLSRAAYFRPPTKSAAWVNRYVRERKRNRLYAALKTGMVLRKVYHGILHEVRVGYRCYTYEGQSFPTLYAVVQAIAGSIACQHGFGPDSTRRPGIKHTAVKSPTLFFHRSFRELVKRLPPTKKRKKRAKKLASVHKEA